MGEASLRLDKTIIIIVAIASAQLTFQIFYYSNFYF